MDVPICSRCALYFAAVDAGLDPRIEVAMSAIRFPDSKIYWCDSLDLMFKITNVMTEDMVKLGLAAFEVKEVELNFPDLNIIS